MTERVVARLSYCHCEPKAWQSHEIASSSLTSFGIPRNDRESHCEQSVAISGEQNSKSEIRNTKQYEKAVNNQQSAIS